jgi:hypothetical protein
MNRTHDAFDPFAADDDESESNFQDKSLSTRESDPWSSSTWPTAEFLNNQSHDATFDSSALFEFSATSSSDIVVDSFKGRSLSENPFSFVAQRKSLNAIITEEEPNVHVTIHEQLSCVYDDVSQSPICQVEGTIYVCREFFNGVLC